nr:unnamed protein product [Callosobruchus chinensis]
MRALSLPLTSLVPLVVVLATASVSADLDLLLLHNNDMHARFEETEKNGGTCREDHRNVSCIGGMARVAHEVRRYRKAAADGTGPEVLFLNAGDTFIGTVWYTLFTWNISAAFINALEPDAICLGNHEFDNGVEGLAPFLNHIRCPVVSTNLDLTNAPSLDKVKKSVVLTKGGQKIGIISHLTQETRLISQPGPVIFEDEVEAVRKESERLTAEGVKIIVVLGHSGFLLDQRIAAEVPLVDVVVGGHTNTFLWNGPQPDEEPIDGPYPFVVQQKGGKKVPVVQAYAYTKYLGRLNLTFNDEGDLIKFSGQPELLSSSVHQDEDVLQLLEVYRPEINRVNSQVVGQSKVTLEGGDVCRTRECNFGNLIADAMVAYIATVSPDTWTSAPIAVVNGGSIRTTIMPVKEGDVTRGELLGAMPFGNSIVTLSLNGEDLVKTLEIGARSNGETSKGEFLQVSGIKVVYDMTKPALSRVLSVKVRCGNCRIPEYEDVVPTKNYTIIAPSFLAIDGGDNHYILSKHGANKQTADLGDIDLLVWYFERYSPVIPEVQGRIRFDDGSSCSGASIIGINGLSVTVLTMFVLKLSLTT